MKAKVKSTGGNVDIVRFDHKSLTFFTRDGNEYYPIDIDSDIHIPPHPDWQAYRMEVAKECMAATQANPDEQLKGISFAKQAEWAVQAADALINALKEQKDEQKDTDDEHKYMAKYYEPNLTARELSQKIAKYLEDGCTLVATGKYDEQYDKYVFCKSKKGE